MNFTLTEEQKMLKVMVQDFASKELEPIAARIDEEARFPEESIRKMAELGITGLGFPEEYGGSGGGAVELCLATEEISRACAATGAILLASTDLDQPMVASICQTDTYMNDKLHRRLRDAIEMLQNTAFAFQGEIDSAPSPRPTSKYFPHLHISSKCDLYVWSIFRASRAILQQTLSLHSVCSSDDFNGQTAVRTSFSIRGINL